MNSLLYLAVVLIWGTTWIAIQIQHGVVPAEVSIFWRFAVASVCLWTFLILTNRSTQMSMKGHFLCFLQGITVFGLNFVCFYHAVAWISSGLESVIFSMAVLFNTVNGWIFLRQRITKNILMAAPLGLIGIILLFWQDLAVIKQSPFVLYGIGLSALGTYCFSIGNMISATHQRAGRDVMATNAWGMLYGTIVIGVFALFNGDDFTPVFSYEYLGALVYLGIFGSVIGFGAYFMLVGRIGASQAAYATLLFPLVALMVSTVFENYVWHWNAVVGLGFILSGNAVMFYRPSRIDIKRRTLTTFQMILEKTK